MPTAERTLFDEYAKLQQTTKDAKNAGAALLTLVQQDGEELEIELSEGVYAAVAGPSYETPAEIYAFRAIGADLVGMSTVPEVIAARHSGIRVLGISCVTNMAAGTTDALLNQEEVLETAARVKSQFIALLRAVIPRISEALP